MPIANIDTVKEVLKDFEPRLRAVEDRAWKRTQAVPGYHLFMYGRTRSNINFDFIVQEAVAEFTGDKNIHLLVERQTIKFLFRDRVLIRFKKGNSKGIGGNIVTQAVLEFIDPELTFPGMLPDIHRVEVCHQIDPLGRSLRDVSVVARDRNRRVWAYTLPPAATGAEIIPLPPRPTDDAPPVVTPKVRKPKSGELDDE
jgi:hypothetical protein